MVGAQADACHPRRKVRRAGGNGKTRPARRTVKHRRRMEREEGGGGGMGGQVCDVDVIIAPRGGAVVFSQLREVVLEINRTSSRG